MTPRNQALLRLLAVQASWTYERMSGIGVGHASAPLLRDLHAQSDPATRRAAVARSAEFFNSHPYLAGIAVGATVRSERDNIPPSTVSRLRLALSGPLGSLGDQFVWAGMVPALIGLALAGVPWVGAWAILTAVIIHNVVRFRITAWGLDLGLREGIAVGAALQRSWIARRAADFQLLGAFSVGLGTVIAAFALLDVTPGGGAVGVLGVVVVGTAIVLSPLGRSRVSGLRIALTLLVVAGLVIGSSR